MRCPDAESGGNGRYGQPNASHLTARLARMVKQIDRCEGGQNADESGKCHQPQIMFRDDAIIDLQHVAIPGSGNTALTGISGKTVRTSKTTHAADAGDQSAGGHMIELANETCPLQARNATKNVDCAENLR